MIWLTHIRWAFMPLSAMRLIREQREQLAVLRASVSELSGRVVSQGVQIMELRRALAAYEKDTTQ